MLMPACVSSSKHRVRWIWIISPCSLSIPALYDLNPGVFRFPGGCIIEGNSLETRYQWKNSVGPVENRPLNENRWNYTFKHKAFPDYFQTLGLGYFEYFLLSEDLGAEPLPVISCGLSCQYESNEVVPMDELDPYIQDALDLIEFANGPVTSKWGKVRADMGHRTLQSEDDRYRQ